MLVGRLQHQHTVTGVLRLDSGLASHAAPEGLAEQIAHALETSGGVDIANRPLHGAGLEGDLSLAEIAEDLAAADIHLRAEVGRDCGVGRNAEVPLVLYNREGTEGIDDFHIVVVGEVLDSIHCWIAVLSCLRRTGLAPVMAIIRTDGGIYCPNCGVEASFLRRKGGANFVLTLGSAARTTRPEPPSPMPPVHSSRNQIDTSRQRGYNDCSRLRRLAGHATGGAPAGAPFFLRPDSNVEYNE